MDPITISLIALALAGCGGIRYSKTETMDIDVNGRKEKTFKKELNDNNEVTMELSGPCQNNAEVIDAVNAAKARVCGSAEDFASSSMESNYVCVNNQYEFTLQGKCK